MKKILLLIYFISVSFFVAAQNKILSIEDAMLKARTTLAPQNLQQLQFFEATNDYIYLKKTNGQDYWMRGNYKIAGQEWPFMHLGTLNTWLREAGSDTAKSMPTIRFTPAGWLMTINGNKILFDPAAKKYKTLLKKELAAKENAEESSAGFIAYLDNYNLFISDGSTARQVTTDGNKDIVYASSVHRDEFGISKGTFWSNKGTQLAFYRMDQSMVTDYPIIDWTPKPAKAELIKYPMAGDKSHHVTVGVYNTATQSTVWLKTGEPAEQYLTNIAWSPDDRYVFVAIVNREQNHMWLNQYDAATGRYIKTIFEESDAKYTEPLVPMQFLKTSPARFIWQSNRDGWNHIYIYDTTGIMQRQLTKGEWEVVEVKGFDVKCENLYFVSTALSPINKTLSVVNIKTGQINMITTESGVHNTQVSADGSTILDAYSTTSNPRTVQLIDINKFLAAKPKMQSAGLKKFTTPTKLLLQADNPLKEYATGELSLFAIPNNAGDSIFCRMYKPINFSTEKKYPVIFYWYGGPHAQMILNAWNGGAGDLWFQYMAQRGYVVFTIDTRGSDNRGKAFEQSIFRKLGEVQKQDMIAAVNYLTVQPYIDKNRMGLFGWSFGGFMTTDFLLNHPGIFKAGVAGGPVTDWKYYEIMYGERYMDTPQENPEGYQATNLIKQAGKLKDKLLLIHGIQDPVVVQQHSVNFVKACVDAGVQIDYMIYPGHEHNVLGKDRAHLYQKVTDYLIEHLK